MNPFGCRRRVSLSLSLLVLLLHRITTADAFLPAIAKTRAIGRPPLNEAAACAGGSPRGRSVALRMSDVPQDDNNNDKARRKNKKGGGHNPQRPGDAPEGGVERRFFRLPPPPEDYFVLVGDLLALSVYSFSDHFVCQDLAQFFLPSPDDAGSASFSAALNQFAQHPPVWLDSSHSYSDHVMSVLLRDATVVHYSPLLQPTGLAATILASCWLLSGYLNEAFAYRNTLDCSTPRTLLVTARSWVVSSILVMLLVLLTSTSSPEHWWQAFTIGDMDYIWDSLTVLCVWRYMASSLLGSGGDGNGDDTSGW